MTIFTSRNGVEPDGPGDDDDGDGGGTGDVKSERYGAKTELQPQSPWALAFRPSSLARIIFLSAFFRSLPRV